MYADSKAAMATAEDLIASMDEASVDVSVVCNIGWVSQKLCEETNDYLLDSAKKYHGRLVPFCAVNPANGKSAAGEVERCAGRGAKGIGELHPDTQGFDLGDKNVMKPVMDAAMRNGMVVLTHASEPVGHLYAGKGRMTPDVLGQFIGNFPDSAIVCAHWGGGLPFYALMPEMAVAMRNVYFDCAASPLLYGIGVFETVTKLVGVGRILFGTDYPLIKQKQLLKQVVASALSKEDKGLILGGNAKKLLRLN